MTLPEKIGQMFFMNIQSEMKYDESDASNYWARKWLLYRLKY